MFVFSLMVLSHHTVFIQVCGGPYGVESAVGAAGPLVTMVTLLILPLFWSLPMGLMSAELACAMPSDGGFIIWVERAFGPFVGFMNGTLRCFSEIVDNSAFPVLFVSYLKTVIPSSIEDSNLYSWLLAIGVVVFCAVLNLYGVEAVGQAGLILSALVLLPFVIMVGMGLPKITPHTWTETPKSISWSLFLSDILWVTSGWDDAGCVAGSVYNPRKTYPRAVAFDVVLVSFTYLLPIAVGVCVDDWRQWDDGSFSEVAPKIGGHWLGVWVAVAAGIGCVGTFNSLLCTSSFAVQCMARMRYLPSFLAYEHPKYETPTAAVLCNAVIIAGISYFPFDAIIDVGFFLYAISLLLEWGALLFLRYREPNMPRPFKIGLSNTWLVVYMAIPMGLCVFVMCVASWLTYAIVGGCFLLALLLYGLHRCILKRLDEPSDQNGDYVVVGTQRDRDRTDAVPGTDAWLDSGALEPDLDRPLFSPPEL